MNAKVDGPRAGRWRLLLALPAILGSLLLVMVAAAGFGEWAALVPLGWLLLAPLLMTPVGERVGTRVGCGYRRPTPGQWALLEPVVAAAWSRCGQDAADAHVFVRERATGVNAYAAGRRSIAVSGGYLTCLADGTLGTRPAAAMLVHEIGHLRAGDTRYGLVAAWLTLPGRIVCAAADGVLRACARHVPGAGAALLLVPLMAAVAMIQLTQHHSWLPLTVLITGVLTLTLIPLIDAALSRAGENAADSYAAQMGAGLDLAEALQAAPGSTNASPGRLSADHPPTGDRIRRLTGRW